MAHINISVGFEFWVEPVQWELKSNLLRPVEKEGRPFKGDAWLMRDEFFHIKVGDTDGVLEFLNKWGPFWEWRSVPLERVWQFQERSKRSVIGTAEEWLAMTPPMTLFETRGQYPHLFINVADITGAIETTITLDLLQRVRFRLCAQQRLPRAFRGRVKAWTEVLYAILRTP